jgi:hypothetical protein
MPFYRVTYAIEVEADTPLEAAKLVDDYMQRGYRSYAPYFDVRDQLEGKEWGVDLEDGTVQEK